MGDEDWDDGPSAPVSAPVNDNFDMGFSFGRGFKPPSQNKFDDRSRGSSGFGTLNDSWEDVRRPGDRGKFESDNNFGKSHGFRDDHDNSGNGESKGFGNSRGNSDDGGFGGSRGFGHNNQVNDVEIRTWCTLSVSF